MTLQVTGKDPCVPLDDEDGYRYRGVAIVRRHVRGTPTSDRGFWIFLTPEGDDDDSNRFYTLKDAKDEVRRRFPRVS